MILALAVSLSAGCLRCSALCIACGAMAAVASQAGEIKVQHGIGAEPKPWTAVPLGHDPDTVRFAVFSDLTGGEREGIFEIAIEQLNLLRPELIVNVGDLVEGGTDPEELDGQWDAFDARARKARAPVFYTGGNHDLMGEEMRRTWEEPLGLRYYHFRYRDLLFLILDTEDHSAQRLREIAHLRDEALVVAADEGWDAFGQTEYANLPADESGMISKSQSDYMLRALAENPDLRWTFLLMHKAPSANGHMSTWQAIEQTLEGRSYTVFHGHRHAYRHQRRKGMDYIRLATTGGVFLRDSGPAMDQIVWVTEDREGAHIANLKMSGILDATGRIPLDGEHRCLEFSRCAEQESEE